MIITFRLLEVWKNSTTRSRGVREAGWGENREVESSLDKFIGSFLLYIMEHKKDIHM
jgi:hypothetical protein